LVSGIFLPFLALRLLQQLKTARSNRETESPSRTVASVSTYRDSPYRGLSLDGLIYEIDLAPENCAKCRM